MGQHEWLVLTCRACRRLIKLPPAMAGKQVICPHCRTKISVPKDAPVIAEAASQNQIPVSRQSDDLTSHLRGHEEWEVGQRPIGGDLEFRSRLHTTGDPTMQPDPDKDMKRVNLRRRKMERTHPDFDDTDLERRKKRRRTSRSHGSAFAETFTKMLVGAVLVLLAVVGWLGWEKWRQPRPASTPSKLVQQGPEIALGADGRPPLETRHFADYGPALASAVRAFAASRTVDELLPLVRDRARVEPKIRAHYTAANPWRPIEINNEFKPDDAIIVDGEFIVLDLHLPNGDTIPLTMVRSGETFLADWESFTGHGEMSWEEFREKRPQQPVLMRVIIERSIRTEYWDGFFADHTTHHCFLLRDMHSRHFLSGYTAKGSTIDNTILRVLRPAPPPANDLLTCFAIVRLAYPPGSTNPQQVHIHEFIEHGWVFRADN
jgi:hypothetical protein